MSTKNKVLTQEHKDAIRKGLTGYKQTDEHKRNTGKSVTGEKNGGWKGDEAGDNPKHRWVERQLGKASDYQCIDCTNQALDWSNVDHLYRRDLDDYAPRCRSCHMIHDFKFNLVKKVKCKVQFKNVFNTSKITI